MGFAGGEREVERRFGMRIGSLTRNMIIDWVLSRRFEEGEDDTSLRMRIAFRVKLDIGFGKGNMSGKMRKGSEYDEKKQVSFQNRCQDGETSVDLKKDCV